VPFEFKLSLNSSSSFVFKWSLSFSHLTQLFPTSNRPKEVMSNSLALREFTIPPRREIRSLLAFSNKSAKKSRNFRCNAQNPSTLSRSCPTCWDITLRRRAAKTESRGGLVTVTQWGPGRPAVPFDPIQFGGKRWHVGTTSQWDRKIKGWEKMGCGGLPCAENGMPKTPNFFLLPPIFIF
jgi:hypothetical protein